MIIEVINVNPDNTSFIVEGGNDPIEGGEDTKDKVFLLSVDETKKYFTNDDDRKANITPYDCLSVKIEDYHRCCFSDVPCTAAWRLRSPGEFGNDTAYVEIGGAIWNLNAHNQNQMYARRPALWVNL